MHTPGHTAGSISILCDDGNAIVGDMLMGGYLGGALLPRCPNPHYFAESAAANHMSLGRVLGRNPVLLHVGHGGPLAADDVRRWRSP